MVTAFTRSASRSCKTIQGRPGFHFSSLFHQSRFRLFAFRPITFPVQPTTPVRVWKSYAPFFTVAAVGLGLSANSQHVYCDAPWPVATVTPDGTHVADNTSLQDYPPPPVSSVSLYQLSFGTVTGICAGVFIKKGIKAVAWFLGGIFVLLQYLSSTSLVRVDWGGLTTRFENKFHVRDTSGISRPPTVLALWKGLLDFLTADFQPRASFIAGLVLGLRIG
ncbi:hypothetical protein E4T56_gene12298 [Termitomyces sp. T112]|nr:hypothetical protein E4T56_gene12298 [Termitomyces sp. T112]